MPLSPPDMTQSESASPIDDIIASATRAERDAKICVAGALNAAFAAKEAELADMQQEHYTAGSLADVDPRREAAEELERLRAQMREHEHTFTMRALPPKDWSDLTAAHGPREGEREAFNPETFPVAIVAASCVKVDGKDAVLPEGKVAELFDVLNQGQRDELFAAAWEANTGRVSVPFSGLASVVLRSTEPS